MSRLITAILISPCISTASIDKVSNSTDIMGCSNTVKFEQRIVIKQLVYAIHQKNFFRIRRVIFDDKHKPVIQ